MLKQSELCCHRALTSALLWDPVGILCFPTLKLSSKTLRERREMNAAVSDIAIRMRSKEIAKGISEDKFKVSAGWVESLHPVCLL